MIAMDTKICPRPGCRFNRSPQPIDQFCKDSKTSDGHAVYCRTCAADRARERMKSPEAKELARQANARYYASDHGRARIRATYTSPEYREKVNEYAKEYSKRPDVKLKLAMKVAAYRTRNALKHRARKVCTLAILSKKIVQPDHCEWCNGPALPKELQAHHWRGYDPEHWLDVKYVHRTCHLKCEKVKPEDWP